MKKFRLLSLLCILVLISGCGGDGGEGGGVDPAVKITLKSAGVFLNPEKKYDLIIVAPSNVSWTISSSEKWASLDPASGKGETPCTMTLAENPGNDRTATITLKAGKAADTYTFTQSGPKTLILSRDNIAFNANGDAEELVISTKNPWEITNASEASWVTFSKKSGSEGETIRITPQSNPDKTPRGPVQVKILSGGVTKTVTLIQDFQNKAPNAFTIVASPKDPVPYNQPIVLAWNAATDPDGDPIAYEIQFLKNGITWETIETGITATSYTLPEGLLGRDEYHWRIVAADNRNNTTNSNEGILKVDYLHSDNMTYVYMNNTVAGCPPINILFIGDGYTKEEYNANGAFNKHLKESIDGFFSVEPYKTYKDYFKVTVAVAYSKESGVTILADYNTAPYTKKQTRDSRFGLVCTGGTSTTIDMPEDESKSTTNPFRKYICDDLKLTTLADIENWTVLISVNVDALAGTCSMDRNGFSVARSGADYNLGRRMAHEAGGHGFGKLSDEYTSKDGPISAADLSALNTGRATAGNGVWGWRANTDITGKMDEVHWKHYFGREGYGNVGLFEGCHLYRDGVWRPEAKSIMQGSTAEAGFNAPSREAIVRRIMKLVGKEFSYDDFFAKDKYDIVTRSAGHFIPGVVETPPREE